MLGRPFPSCIASDSKIIGLWRLFAIAYRGYGRAVRCDNAPGGHVR
jgi:hypothetical protein